MRTSKPISAISYNSPKFLKSVLDDYIRDGKIEYYAFVQHKAETVLNPITGELETETKDHIHVHIIPNRILDTAKLTRATYETDYSHPDKPLATILFKRSTTSDWFLYAMHDEAYLAAKLQERKYHYQIDDFVSSDSISTENYIFESYHESTFADTVALQKSIAGDQLDKLIKSGFINPANALHVKSYLDLFKYAETRKKKKEDYEKALAYREKISKLG